MTKIILKITKDMSWMDIKLLLKKNLVYHDIIKEGQAVKDVVIELNFSEYGK